MLLAQRHNAGISRHFSGIIRHFELMGDEGGNSLIYYIMSSMMFLVIVFRGKILVSVSVALKVAGSTQFSRMLRPGLFGSYSSFFTITIQNTILLCR